MANAQEATLISVDTAGELTTQPTKVTYIVVTPSTGGDVLELGSGASTATLVKLSGSTANQSTLFDFSRNPLYFPNGIYAQTVDSGLTATIVVTTSGRA